MLTEDKRVLFAAFAMHAMISTSCEQAVADPKKLAGAAWRMADLMVDEEVTDKDSPLAAGLRGRDSG